MSHVKQVRREAEVVIPDAGEKYVDESGTVTKVLDDFVDEGYEPTEEEIREFGEFIGMKFPEDEEFVYIARNALKTPLPKEWKPCETDGDNIYYFNFKTGESKWEHPMDELAQRTFENEKAKRQLKEKKVEVSVLKADLLKKADSSGTESPKAIKVTKTCNGRSENDTLPSLESSAEGEKGVLLPRANASFSTPRGKTGDSLGGISTNSTSSSSISVSSRGSASSPTRTILTESGVLQKEMGKIVPTLVSRHTIKNSTPMNSDVLQEREKVVISFSAVGSPNKASPIGTRETTSSRLASPLSKVPSKLAGDQVSLEERGEKKEGRRAPLGAIDPPGSGRRVVMGTTSTVAPGNLLCQPRSEVLGHSGTEAGSIKFNLESSKITSSPAPFFSPFSSLLSSSKESPLRSEAEEKMIEKIKLEIMQELQVKKESHQKEFAEKSRVLREEHTKDMKTLRDESVALRIAWKREQKEKIDRQLQSVKSEAASKYSDDFHDLERQAGQLQEELVRQQKNTERLDGAYKIQRDTIERNAAEEVKDALQQVVAEVENMKQKKEKELEGEYLQKKAQLEKIAEEKLRVEQDQLDSLYAEKQQKVVKELEEKKKELKLEREKLSYEIGDITECNNRKKEQLQKIVVSSSSTSSSSIAQASSVSLDSVIPPAGSLLENEVKEKKQFVQRIAEIEREKEEKLKKMRIDAEKEKKKRIQNQQIELEKMYYFINAAKKAKESAENTLSEMKSVVTTTVQEAERQGSSSFDKLDNSVKDAEEKISDLKSEKIRIRNKWKEEEKTQLEALQKERERKLALCTPQCNGTKEKHEEVLPVREGSKERSVTRKMEDPDTNLKEFQEHCDKEMAQRKALYQQMEEELCQQLSEERERKEEEDETKALKEAVEQDVNRYIVDVLSRRERLEKEHQLQLERYERVLATMRGEAKVRAARRRHTEFQSLVEQEVAIQRAKKNEEQRGAKDVTADSPSSSHALLSRECNSRTGNQSASTHPVSEEEAIASHAPSHPFPPEMEEELNSHRERIEEEAKEYEKNTVVPLLERIEFLRRQREKVETCGPSVPFSSIVSLLDSTCLEEATQLEHYVMEAEASYQNEILRQEEVKAAQRKSLKLPFTKNHLYSPSTTTIECPATSLPVESSPNNSKRSLSSSGGPPLPGEGSGSPRVENDSPRWIRRVDQEGYIRQLERMYEEQAQHLAQEIQAVREFLQMMETNSRRRREDDHSSPPFTLSPSSGSRRQAANGSATAAPVASYLPSTLGVQGTRRTEEDPPSLSIHSRSSLSPSFPLGVTEKCSIPPFKHPFTPTAEASSVLDSLDNLRTEDAVRLWHALQLDHSRRSEVVQAAKKIWEEEVQKADGVTAAVETASCHHRNPFVGRWDKGREGKDRAEYHSDRPFSASATHPPPRKAFHSSSRIPTTRGMRTGSTRDGIAEGGGRGESERGTPPLYPVTHRTPLASSPPLPLQSSVLLSEPSKVDMRATNGEDIRQLQERLDYLTHDLHLLVQETSRIRSTSVPLCYPFYEYPVETMRRSPSAASLSSPPLPSSTSRRERHQERSTSHSLQTPFHSNGYMEEDTGGENTKPCIGHERSYRRQRGRRKEGGRRRESSPTEERRPSFSPMVYSYREGERYRPSLYPWHSVKVHGDSNRRGRRFYYPPTFSLRSSSSTVSSSSVLNRFLSAPSQRSRSRNYNDHDPLRQQEDVQWLKVDQERNLTRAHTHTKKGREQKKKAIGFRSSHPEEIFYAGNHVFSSYPLSISCP